MILSILKNYFIKIHFQKYSLKLSLNGIKEVREAKISRSESVEAFSKVFELSTEIFQLENKISTDSSLRAKTQTFFNMELIYFLVQRSEVLWDYNILNKKPWWEIEIDKRYWQ